MPYNRETVDIVKDILTSPARMDQAIMTFGSALFGGPSAMQDIWTVLFNPTMARPEQLKTFSERMGMQEGIKSFAVDTLASPTALLALTGSWMAKGAHGLKLAEGLSPAARKLAEEVTTPPSRVGLVSEIFRPYNAIMEKLGFSQASRMDIVLSRRANQLISEFGGAYSKIVNDFGGREAWERSKGTIAKLGMGLDVPASAQELAASNALRDTIFDPLWDRMGTLLKKSQVEDDPNYRQIGYLKRYFPHVLTDWTGDDFLSMSPERIAHRMRSSGVYKQLVDTKQIPDVLLDVAKLQDDGAKMRLLLQTMDQPGMAQLFNPFLMHRKSGELSDELLGRLLLDPDKVVNAYVQKAARTVAFYSPLDSVEASFIHLKPIENGRNLAELTKLHAKVRQAINAGDTVAETEFRQQARGLAEEFSKIPEQAPIGHQIQRFIMETIPGWRPNMSKEDKAKLIEWLPTAHKPTLKIMEEWYNALAGKHELKRWSLGGLMSDMASKIQPWLAQAENQLNTVGAKVGAPKFGTWAAKKVLDLTDERTTAEIERLLVAYSATNVMALRPSGHLVNLTQPFLVGGPTMGFGNILQGAQVAMPKMMSAYVDAWKAKKAGISWSDALHGAMKRHAPEYMNAGIPLDYHGMEMAVRGAMEEGGAKGWLHRLFKRAMFSFEATETANRMASFYGSRGAWEKTLARNAKAFGGDFSTWNPIEREKLLNLHASREVYTTQFVPTPGRLTPLQNRVGPALRQFSTYPISFTNWLVDLAWKGAIDVKAGVVGSALAAEQGWNEGMLLRALPGMRYAAVAGGLVRFTEDVLGVDLGQKVLENSINMGNPRYSPLGVLPIPPIPGAVISMGENLMSDGSADDATMVHIPGVGQIPVPKTIFPMGINISNLYKASDRVKGTMLTDESGRGIQQMDDATKWLVASGFSTVSSRRDYQKIRRMGTIASRIREYRRRMAQGLASGDLNTVRKLQAGYRDEFSDAPPLAVEMKDINRVLQQQSNTRLQRFADSIGQELVDYIDPAFDMAGLSDPNLVQSVGF